MKKEKKICIVCLKQTTKINQCTDCHNYFCQEIYCQHQLVTCKFIHKLQPREIVECHFCKRIIFNPSITAMTVCGGCNTAFCLRESKCSNWCCSSFPVCGKCDPERAEACNHDIEKYFLEN